VVTTDMLDERDSAPVLKCVLCLGKDLVWQKFFAFFSLRIW
jgi:hypothetical protein